MMRVGVIPRDRDVPVRAEIALGVALSACVLLCSIAVPRVSAADYPAKPIRVIVPYAAGGGTDTAARIVGQKLSEKWNQTVVVDNRPGAAGIIGSDIVAKAAPDGHTLLVAAGAHAINPSLYAKLPFNVHKNF